MSDDNRTQESDDGQPPALPAPGDGPGDDRPRGRATGRDYSAARRYSPEERMALIYQAIRDGVSATSDRHNVPRSTLTTWLEEYGGIVAVQEQLQAQTFADFVRAERSIYDAVARRADTLGNDELMVTFRKLVDARLIPTLTGSEAAGDGAQAGAAAQANVTVTIGDKDGERVIDLGPPPEEP